MKLETLATLDGASKTIASAYPSVSTRTARHHCISAKLLARACHELADCGQTPCRGQRWWNRRVQPIKARQEATGRATGRPRKLETANGHELVRLSRYQYAIGLRDIAALEGASAAIGEAVSVSAGHYRQHVNVPTTYGHVERVTGLNRGLVGEALPAFEETGWGVVVASGVRGDKSKPTRIDLTCPAEMFEAVRQAKRIDDKRRRHAGTPKSFVPVLVASNELVTNPSPLEMSVHNEKSEERQQVTQSSSNQPRGERTTRRDAA